MRALTTDEAIACIKAIEAYPHEWLEKDAAKSALKKLYDSTICDRRRA